MTIAQRKAFRRNRKLEAAIRGRIRQIHAARKPVRIRTVPKLAPCPCPGYTNEGHCRHGAAALPPAFSARTWRSA
jgi:uncharacterized Zn finger protein